MIYFISALGSEFIKIGYTSGSIEKRMAALQTGNALELELLFTVDGTLLQEKRIHKILNDLFKRLKVFNNPINEWYPSENPVIKLFIEGVKRYGINYSLDNIDSILVWDFPIKDKEIFSIRHLEKLLRARGMSIKQAKTVISQSKKALMDAVIVKREN